MRLGTNSRYLLELLAALGIEALEALTKLPNYHKLVHCSSDQNFWRRANALLDKGLLASDAPRSTGNWVAQLTKSGKDAITDGIDPETEWSRPWDRQWRLFAFDLPQGRGAERQALRLWMKQRRLGMLQHSLWITPKDLGNWTADLNSRKIDPSAVALIRGEFEGGKAPIDYVNAAWDFEKTNAQYDRYLEFLGTQNPSVLGHDQMSDWFQSEVALWRAAFALDPFFPRELWPSIYLGEQAYAARKAAYQTWKDRLLG